jgi:hypothetical protein
MRRLPYPIAAQASSVPPRILLLDASSQKPPSHRLPRRPCGARPRMQFELLSSDCAMFPSHYLGTVALRHLRLHSALALPACSRFCSAGIRSPMTGLGPFGSVAARSPLARSAVVSFWSLISWDSSFLNNCGRQLVYVDTVDAIRSLHQTYSGRTADS